MKNLKCKFQLKIKIPKQQITEETKNNAQLKLNDNNRNTISQITDNIYISGYLIGKNLSYLKNNNFTHVINCSLGSSMEYPHDELLNNQRYENEGIKYLSINLRDDPEIDIIYHFYQIIDFISSDKETSNQKILFHCIEGISRAPAMVAGYLMWKDNLTSLSAIELIKSKRNCIDINLGFNIQLQKWENYLFSSPKELQIFKLTPNIRLLKEREIDLNTDTKEDYLLKFKYKLFYFNNIYKMYNGNNNNLLINKINNNTNNTIIFNVFKDITKEFIRNVIKYDKTLLRNDLSSLVEIRY